MSSADVNAADKKGNTALHVAIRGFRADAVGLLLNAKADANARNQRSGFPAGRHWL